VSRWAAVTAEAGRPRPGISRGAESHLRLIASCDGGSQVQGAGAG